MEINDIKLYLKIDGDYEDIILMALKGAAEEYLTGAGIDTDYEKGTYRLVILMLISHWYTNRSIVNESTKLLSEIPFGVRPLIQQLQFTPKEVLG